MLMRSSRRPDNTTPLDLSSFRAVNRLSRTTTDREWELVHGSTAMNPAPPNIEQLEERIRQLEQQLNALQRPQNPEAQNASHGLDNTEEEFLRMQARVLESMAEGVSVIDEHGYILYTNPAEDRIFGYEAGELIGQHVTVQNAYTPEENKQRVDDVINLLKRGGAWSGEWFNRKKNGEPFYTYARITAISVNKKNFWVCVQEDITDRKRRERDMRESSQQLGVALAASGMGNWSWDAKTDRVTLSQRAAEIFRLPASQPLTWTELLNSLHPDDREHAKAEVERVISENADYAIEYRLIGQDRGQRWVCATGRPIYDADAHVSGMLGVVQDVTERKMLLEREQQARATAELLNSIGPLLLAELDRERLVQAVTDLATQLTGAQFGAFFHNVLDERGESYMLYALSGLPREAFAKFPMPRNTEVFSPTFHGVGVIRSDDITKDFRYGKNPPYRGMPEGHLPVRSYLAAPVVSRSGDVLGGLFFGHSEGGVFTEQHERLVVGIASQAAIAMDNARLFDQLRRERARVEQANMALRSANADLEQFAYSASHDLQEPLRMVSIYSQMLKKRFAGQLGAVGDEYIGYAVQGAIRMESLVRDLLAYTQASSMSAGPAVAVDAKAVLEHALSNLQVAIKFAGSHQTDRRPRDLGAAPGDYDA